MMELIKSLYPICRSIAGPGLRQTIREIGERIPLAISEVPTGTPVLDWTVPQEWSLRRATLTDGSGRLLIDTDRHNLHVLNYSHPFAGELDRASLEARLHSMPDKPRWIPYRTSYYTPTWGLCLSDADRTSLTGERFDVRIDTTVADGSLTIGECVIPGRDRGEILLSCHACHPSLANDNLSGIAVAVEVAQRLLNRDNRYSVRLVFLPGTIGSITWLSRHRESASSIVAGLVLSCLGDAGGFHFKQSRREQSVTDEAMREALADCGEPSTVIPFVPYGYDERQYCSPGFDLPVGCLMRTPNGKYREYHTSADDVSLIDGAALDRSARLVMRWIERVESIGEFAGPRPAIIGTGRRFRNLSPFGEPMLGRRGLYAAMGGRADVPTLQMALLWMLNYGDALHGVDWIASRSGIEQRVLLDAAELLMRASLLEQSD
jgi:aminopeptidase-like protein